MPLVRLVIAITQTHRGSLATRELMCVWLALFTSLTVMGHANASPITVKITSTPPQQQIRPDLDLAQVTVQVLHQGQPLTAGHVRAKLTSPTRTSWLSTDFPIVEGTALLDLASDLQQGALTFAYLFPIRGIYTFDLTVSSNPDGPAFSPTTIRQLFQLAENPAEVRNTWLLVGGLLLLGVIAGMIFARSAAAQEALLLAGLMALVSSGFIWPYLFSSIATATPNDNRQHVAQGDNGWNLEVHSTPTATVGQLAPFEVVLKQNDTVFSDPTQTSIVLHHVEDDKAVFQATTYAQAGQTAQKIQFFDGAPHTVTITAQPSEQPQVPPLQAVVEMDVKGLQPPMAVKIRTLSLLIGVLIAGMAGGFFLLGNRKERGSAAV